MFLGEIGGNMGLFLGCSLLTIFEFIDVIIKIATRRGGQVLHMQWSDTGVEATVKPTDAILNLYFQAQKQNYVSNNESYTTLLLQTVQAPRSQWLLYFHWRYILILHLFVFLPITSQLKQIFQT